MAEQSTGPLGRLRERNPAAGRLMEELERYTAAKATSVVSSAAQALGRGAERLGAGTGGSLGTVVKGGKKITEGKSPARAAVEIGAGGVKDRIKGVLGRLTGGGRGGAGPKAVVIVEDIDVGVPVRVAYDQWTRFGDFASFTKGVRSVDKADDTTSNWTARVLWSTRSWQARVTEQIPDQRIAWTSEGAKGTTKGAVTFHPLEENLTKVLLVVEYHPKGLFERTGNIWRAQGRRLRLDLKHYRRQVMMRSRFEEVEGWRGEIRDGEVVVDHEDALAEEERRHDEAVNEGEGHDGPDSEEAWEEPVEDGERPDDLEEDREEDLPEDDEEDAAPEPVAEEDDYDEDTVEDEGLLPEEEEGEEEERPARSRR
ncbi:SRPBCC family protein [Marinactinospora thermotolerans]|uniref:Polyketide cyclase / dehydrase and lipid transport n=1 Tax=Marinactinospora thermotolerans DSM 45154 TaxID=1122192 RepID=A0A1T4P3V7_9ACTN|nr:SRPBCC family protein [Marinactinospora thermotolerans]SJZ85618.1 Polyketide cyclase / dehydrase and lipid transport [Marinactinospora thermotolerans DSM 45154]